MERSYRSSSSNRRSGLLRHGSSWADRFVNYATDYQRWQPKIFNFCVCHDLKPLQVEIKEPLPYKENTTISQKNPTANGEALKSFRTLSTMNLI